VTEASSTNFCCDGKAEADLRGIVERLFKQAALVTSKTEYLIAGQWFSLFAKCERTVKS
jgi:hypothetical protein